MRRGIELAGTVENNNIAVEDSLYTNWLKSDDRKRADKVYGLLDFNVAGETQNKRLMFYMILSSYNTKLTSFVFYRGDSSAGKNHVINAVLDLFPKDDIFIVDSATPAALNYDQALAGKKIAYLRELNENSLTLLDLLKAMYNPEGYVHKETVRDAQTQEFRVKTHLKDRIGVITTLSFESIQVDLINRSWVLTPDQSYQQNEAIVNHQLNAQSNAIERDIKQKEISEDFHFVSQAIRSLDFSYEVFVPYSKRLYPLFPTQHLNVRRDVAKILNLIKIITIFNQKNRKSLVINNKKWLFAEYFDLKEALDVSQDLFINTVLHLDEIMRSILDYMEAQKNFFNIDDVLEDNDQFYTITDIYMELKETRAVSRRTTQRKLDQLYMEGYLFKDKSKGTWRFKLMKNYDVISSIKLHDIRDDIISDIEQQYIFWSNKTEGVIDDYNNN